MKIVLQRVSSASIDINNKDKDSIEKGLVLLVGIKPDDDMATANFMAEKAMNLRIFEDENEKLNLSQLDINGETLIVSNFTLYANCQKGRRPSFIDSARPETALPIYDEFVKVVRSMTDKKVITGQFGADMKVGINNDGPVTIVLDSDEIMKRK